MPLVVVEEQVVRVVLHYQQLQGHTGGNGLANAYRTGSNVTYAGGGGGACWSGGSPGAGGPGGGGAGGNYGSPGNGVDANTGGGGGGSAGGDLSDWWRGWIWHCCYPLSPNK